MDTVNNPQNAQTASEALDVQTLEGLHPRWWVWRSDESGHWWAARRTNLKPAEKEAGCIPFAKADCALDLGARLAEQDELSAQAVS